jgi:hypothetical protein
MIDARYGTGGEIMYICTEAERQQHQPFASPRN